MGDEQADQIYGRVCREFLNLGKEVALYESELKKIGRNLETTGRQVAGLSFGFDKEQVKSEVDSMSDLIKKYEQAKADYAQKKIEKEKIEHGS